MPFKFTGKFDKVAIELKGTTVSEQITQRGRSKEAAVPHERRIDSSPFPKTIASYVLLTTDAELSMFLEAMLVEGPSKNLVAVGPGQGSQWQFRKRSMRFI